MAATSMTLFNVEFRSSPCQNGSFNGKSWNLAAKTVLSKTVLVTC